MKTPEDTGMEGVRLAVALVTLAREDRFDEMADVLASTPTLLLIMGLAAAARMLAYSIHEGQLQEAVLRMEIDRQEDDG